MVETLTRNWGWVLLRGLAAIAFGVLTLINPGITLATLILFFGAYALADGLFMVVSAIGHRRGQPRWVAMLAGGVLGIVVGLMTFFMPAVTGIALLGLIAAWAIVVGVAEIAAAIRMRREIEGEWMLIVAGLLAVGFGFLLVARPGAGALAMAFWIGGFAIVSGIMLTVLAFRLRSWGRAHDGYMAPHPL